MATNYIKVRPHVAQRLGLIRDRYIVKDGCVLLYEKDLKLVNPAYLFGQTGKTVADIGGLLLDPYAAKAETMRTAAECTPLPEPADPAWLPRPGEDGSMQEQAPDTADESTADGFIQEQAPDTKDEPMTDDSELMTDESTADDSDTEEEGGDS